MTTSMLYKMLVLEHGKDAFGDVRKDGDRRSKAYYNKYVTDVKNYLLNSGKHLIPIVKHEKGGVEDTGKTIEVEHMEAANIQTTTLIEDEVYNTILAGVEPAVCFEEALPVLRTRGDGLRWVKSAAVDYAEQVPEGSAPEVANTSYENIQFSLDRYAYRPLITTHLIDTGLFDIVEFRLRQAGTAMANAYNRRALDELVDGISTNSVEEGTTGAMKATDLAAARVEITKVNGRPDTLILYPSAEGDLLGDSNLIYASYAGSNTVLKTGSLFAPILGLKPYVCNVTTGSGASATWGDTSSGDIKAMVYDSKHPVAVMAAQDMKIAQFDDPLRSLHNIIIERWIDCEMTEETVGCTITRGS